jgi:aldehyde:ferredoxin oxidoreductase
MAGGYSGKILEIDLTSGRIEKKPLDGNEAEMFIGGRGLGVKWLWDLTKPGQSWLDPETPICFVSGPLSGLPAPSTGRLNIVTRSASTFPKANPKTTGMCHSSVGGRWAPELKFAGYDAVIVTGAASSPVGIVIENDNVNIVPADKYWGMGIDSLQKALDNDVGRFHKSVCIGPAGENKVRYASIMTEIHHAAGRGGTGAVMGSKKLKFIAVRGTNAIGIHDMPAWKKTNKQVWTDMLSSSGFQEWRRYGTASVLTASSDLCSEAVYNFREGTYEHAGLLSAEKAYRNLWVGDSGCYMCPIACMHRGVIRTGRFSGMTHDGPEYEGVMMGANCGVKDFNGWMANISAADDYGLCFISMGNILGFCMEAYEKGLIKASDLDGVELKWGDVDAMLKIQKKVAFAEGCGKLLGQNLRALVNAWGKECEHFAIETKGQGWAAWNVRSIPNYEITYLTANRGGDHLTGKDIPTQNIRTFTDCTGVCLFPQFVGFKFENLNILLNAATGYNLTMDDCMKTAERVYTLERSFNTVNGFTRDDDTVPPRMYKEALTKGAAKGGILKRENIEKLLDEYYANRGWDSRGKPSKTRLNELGLDFVNL